VDEAQDGNKIARRNISNITYVDDNPLMAESEEEIKNLLTKVKEKSEKDMPTLASHKAQKGKAIPT